jgi:hypothetical protein
MPRYTWSNVQEDAPQCLFDEQIASLREEPIYAETDVLTQQLYQRRKIEEARICKIYTEDIVKYQYALCENHRKTKNLGCVCPISHCVYETPFQQNARLAAAKTFQMTDDDDLTD